MLERREDTTNDSLHDDGTVGESASRAVVPFSSETSTALSLPDAGANYGELFTRLQKLIDNATQTIRDLRRENAELSGKISQYDAYIQMRSEVVDNEVELQQAASRLEALLEASAHAAAAHTAATHAATPVSAAPPAPVAPPAPPRPVVAAPTPLHRVYEPPTEAHYDTPVTNGYTPAREVPPVPLAPAPPAFVAPPTPPAPTPPLVTFDTPPLPPTPRAPIIVVDPEAETREATAHPTFAAPEVQIRQEGATRTAPTPVIAPAPPLSVFPAAAPTVASAPTPSGTSERYAGTYTLVVYPFTRFSDLGQFQSALQELVGIHDVQVRRFAQGTLEMRLSYDGNMPLMQALRSLTIRVEEVDEEEPYRLRVRLDLNHGA